MNAVNKTLYIPLYGKAQVSKRGIILHDPKAEEIWDAEGFPLSGKAVSKWLTYFMAMRSRVFDDWTARQLEKQSDVLVLHIGCGMDGRHLRLNTRALWYDTDLPAVIEERKKYYRETETYHMLSADACETDWLSTLPQEMPCIVILEGITMFLPYDRVVALLAQVKATFPEVHLLLDVYTTFGAKASKYKNPVNEVGVTQLHGIDDPEALAKETGLTFLAEHTMTPAHLVAELKGFDQAFFQTIFAGPLTQKIYRLFEFQA